MTDHPMIHFLKIIGDYVFGGITIAAVLSWLPHLTAILAFVWWCIRIFETDTVQRWLGRGPKKEADG